MKCANYRDGGTRSFKDYSFDRYFKQENVEICQDNRIGVKEKNNWYLGYPDKGRLLTEEERVFVIEEVISHLGKEYEYVKYLYEDVKSSNLDCTFKDDFRKVFSTKSYESRGDYSKNCYKTQDNFSLIDECGECTLKDNDEKIVKQGTIQECFLYYKTKYNQ